MNVFCDFHHPALYYSLLVLFEDRLGMNLYRPIGLDWKDSGYWKILDLCLNEYQRREKLLELLIPNGIPPSSTQSWNHVISSDLDFCVVDQYGGCLKRHKAVTFKQFKQMKFDLIIATFINNVIPFEELARIYQDNCPVIVQVGNEWDLNCLTEKNVLASIKPRETDIKNIVFYKQEFDQTIFAPTNVVPDNLLSSFVCYDDISPPDLEYLSKLEAQFFGSYQVKLYGKHSPDGFIESQKKLSQLMEQSKFGVQIKAVGDGFGHTLHHWFSRGRPVIFRGSYYKDTLAGFMLIHNQTGFDIDKVSPEDLVRIISNMSDSDYRLMCSNVKNTFRQFVDFDRDARNVQKFIEKIR